MNINANAVHKRRFLEIDDVPANVKIDDTPVVSAAPVIDLSAERLARVTEDLAAAKAAGFEVKRTFFELGTLVNETGVENLRKSRVAYDGLQSVADGLSSLIEEVKSEGRLNRIVPINNLVYTNDGRLSVKDTKTANAATLTDISYLQLAQKLNIGSGAAKFIRNNQPLSAGAAMINHCINDASDESHVMILDRDSRHCAGRNVFAVLSSKYMPIDLSEVAEKLLRVEAFRDAKIDVTYDWETTQAVLDVTFHTDIDAGAAACGEYFKAGVRFKTADNGGHALSASSYLVRNLCLNFIILDEAEIKLDRIIHKGSKQSRLDRLANAASAGSKSIEHFASKWTAASKLVIDDPRELDVHVKKHEDVKAWAECSTIERVAGLVHGYSKAGYLPTLSQHDVSGIASAYFKDEITHGASISLSGIVNSITRYAHEDMDRWSGDALERAAGSLTWNQPQPIFQYVAVSR